MWEWEGHLGKVKAAKVGLGGSAWEEPCHCRILTMGGSLNCFHSFLLSKCSSSLFFCPYFAAVLSVVLMKSHLVFSAVPDSR